MQVGHWPPNRRTVDPQRKLRKFQWGSTIRNNTDIGPHGGLLSGTIQTVAPMGVQCPGGLGSTVGGSHVAQPLLYSVLLEKPTIEVYIRK